jgi:hypothetical protein
MKYLYFGLLLLTSPATAQITEIQKNPDIDWAVIIDLTLPSDPLLATADEDANAHMAVLKLFSDDDGIGGYIDHTLNSRLWEVARDGSWEMYADASLTQRLSFEKYMQELTQPDTTITFDPNTYEETVRIGIPQAVFPFEAPLVKVRQILLYSNRKANFEIIPLAIAPCLETGEVLYWLRMPAVQPEAPGSLQKDANIVWAMRYKTEASSPDMDAWTEIKNTTGPMPERFLDRVRNDTLVELLDPEGEILRGKSRACLFACTDTLVVFDPQTWQDVQKIQEIGLDYEDVRGFQLVEDWYWHVAESALTMRLRAIAPQYQRPAENNENLSPQRPFYRRCKGG